MRDVQPFQFGKTLSLQPLKTTIFASLILLGFLGQKGMCLEVSNVIGVRGGIIYVDGAKGSDKNTGSYEAPLKTIQKCALVARNYQTCSIHSGTYRETLIPKGNYVTFLPVKGDTVTIAATDAVPKSKWTYISNGVGNRYYSTPITLNPKLPANEVYLNGIPIPEAQWPAPSPDPMHPNWASAAEGTTMQADTNTATIMSQNLPSFDPAGTTIHWWSGTDPWMHLYGLPTQASAGKVTFNTIDKTCTNNSLKAPYPLCPQPGGNFYITGSKKFLTANTWMYDAKAGILYWMPPAGISPLTANLEVKQRATVVDLSGKRGIKIQGLNLLGGGVLTDSKSMGNVLDGINATYLAHVVRPHSSVPSEKESWGIVLMGNGNTLKNSTIAYSTSSGVTVNGTNQVIKNNLIHDLDSFGDYSAAIFIDGYHQGPDLTNNISISHNTIYNTGRSGINFNLSSIQTVSNVDIGSNYIFNTMTLTMDGAAIYASSRTGTTGTNIHDNWIHNNPDLSGFNYPKKTTKIYPRADIYYDNASGGVKISHNSLWGAKTPVFIHGSPSLQTMQNIFIENNTLIPEIGNSNCSINLGFSTADNVTVKHNRLYYNILGNPKGLVAIDNLPASPGADLSSNTVGCNLPECKTKNSAPPKNPPKFPTSVSPLGVICTPE